jgi:hypothetical protein
MGWKPPRDQDHYIDAGALLNASASLIGVFLGDIHRSQKIDPDGICWYSGSPITLDFGEKMPKGVLIHKFEKNENKIWERVEKPELRSLLAYAPTLKFHKQLGVIDDPDKIPFDALAKHQNQYLQFTVSAEVYAQVTRQMPQLFESPQISWDHTLEEISREAETTSSDEQLQVTDIDQVAYYKPLIEQWIRENGKELTKIERDEALARIIKDFEKRE